MTKVDQRKLAMQAAMYFRKQGASIEDFQTAVDHEFMEPSEVRDALSALQECGELEHLIQWVWSFTG